MADFIHFETTEDENERLEEGDEGDDIDVILLLMTMKRWMKITQYFIYNLKMLIDQFMKLLKKNVNTALFRLQTLMNFPIFVNHWKMSS